MLLSLPVGAGEYKGSGTDISQGIYRPSPSADTQQAEATITPSAEPSSAEDVLSQQKQYFLDFQKQVEETQAEMEQYKALYDKVNGPLLQKLISIVKNDEIKETAVKLFEGANWKNFGIYQLILMVALMIFKAWRNSQAKSFTGRLWTSCYTMFLYAGASLYIIPILVFGQGYRDLLVAIYQVLSSS